MGREQRRMRQVETKKGGVENKKQRGQRREIRRREEEINYEQEGECRIRWMKGGHHYI